LEEGKQWWVELKREGDGGGLVNREAREWRWGYL
jgi:hypothetical protein